MAEPVRIRAALIILKFMGAQLVLRAKPWCRWAYCLRHLEAGRTAKAASVVGLEECPGDLCYGSSNLDRSVATAASTSILLELLVQPLPRLPAQLDVNSLLAGHWPVRYNISTFFQESLS